MVGPVVFFLVGLFSYVLYFFISYVLCSLFIDLFTKQEQNLKISEKP